MTTMLQPWFFTPMIAGCPRWTRLYADGAEACKTWRPMEGNWQWEARHLDPDDGKWKMIDYGDAKSAEEAKDRCDAALQRVEYNLDVDRIRAHPLYRQAVAFITTLIPRLNWEVIWREGQTQQGLVFQATNGVWMRCQSGTVHAALDNNPKYYNEKVQAVLYAAGIAEAHAALRDVFFKEGLLPEEIASYDNKPMGYPMLGASNEVSRMLFADCKADGNAARIVDGMLEQSRVALAEGRIQKHNKAIHAYNLYGKLQAALRDGVTPEDILAWAQIIQKKLPPVELPVSEA